MDTKINYDLAAGVGELSEAYEFLLRIVRLAPETMYDVVAARDPAFIEHCECMDEPPANYYEFWTGFGSWTMTYLRFKYRNSWDTIVDAYFGSPLHQSKVQQMAMWSDIEGVLKECGFE